jgi:adenylate cyclase
MGVGINTGLASLDVGSGSTAMGDAVNIAFRLESATKTLGVDMVLSESAYRHLPERCWKGAARALQLKGKRVPVRVIGISFHDAERLSATLRAGTAES